VCGFKCVAYGPLIDMLEHNIKSENDENYASTKQALRAMPIIDCAGSGAGVREGEICSYCYRGH